VLRFFDIAEQRVKEVEQLHQNLSVPSINQLRYCGYHLVRALVKTSHEEVEKETSKAIQHCQRAIYDAYEIGIVFMLEQVRLFQGKFSDEPETLIVLPDYISILTHSQTCSDLIGKVREEEHEARDKYYEKCQNHYDELKGCYRKLEKASPLIASQIKGREKKERKDARKFILSTILMILAIIIAIVAIKFAPHSDAQEKAASKAIETTSTLGDGQ